MLCNYACKLEYRRITFDINLNDYMQEVQVIWIFSQKLNTKTSDGSSTGLSCGADLQQIRNLWCGLWSKLWTRAACWARGGCEGCGVVSSVLTKPYPLDLPVCLSVITTASSMSPKASKYFLSEASFVWYGSPPTKILVKVVSFWSGEGCMTSRAPFMNWCRSIGQPGEKTGGTLKVY